MKHIGNMAKIMLATGLIVSYGYMEVFFGWYSANDYEWFMIKIPYDRPVRIVLLVYSVQWRVPNPFGANNFDTTLDCVLISDYCQHRNVA